MKTPRASCLFVLILLGLAAPVGMLAADSAKPSDAKPADPKASAPAKPAPADAVSAALSQDAAASFQANNYKLRPTDVINVSVAEDGTTTKDYRISVDGTITLVYLNDHPIKVSGLTLGQAVDLIRKTYMDEKIFIKPSITAEVREFSPRTINMLGAFAKPGQIQIPPQKELTLVAATSAAGGPTERAARVVTITRVLPDGKTQKLENVDLYGAVHDASKDIPIQEGDTIYIGESMLKDEWR